VDQADVTPDPDELLEAVLTEPELFNATQTMRLVARLEHDDSGAQQPSVLALGRLDVDVIVYGRDRACLLTVV